MTSSGILEIHTSIKEELGKDFSIDVTKNLLQEIEKNKVILDFLSKT